MVICKSPAELEKMHRAGLVVWGALEKMRAMIKPGISTKDLDEFAEAYSEEHHARPAFKGYRGYPGSVCTSINQEVVHGIPSASRKLKEGDILSMDFGVELDGYFGDAALTVPVGKISPEREKLLRVTRESLERAIENVRAGIGSEMSRQPCSSGSKRTVFRSFASSWGTASEPGCTKSRRFRTTARRDRVRGCRKAWFSRLSRW